MRTLMQTTEIAYNAIDFQDAVIMLPLVDSVTNDYRQAYKNLREWDKKKKAGEKIWDSDFNKYLCALKSAYRQLEVFGKLGFPCSEPEAIQGCDYLHAEKK